MSDFSTPFDEFEHPCGILPRVFRRGVLARWMQAGARGLSFATLWVAILTASYLIVRHALPFIMGSQPPISLKSAIPLIAIGVSYFCLIITLRRTPGQRLVGILMGLAFVLWGSEQFFTDQEVISFIDDIVVFLFVVDLSIVIRQNFISCAGEGRVRKARFPIIKTIETFDFSAQPSVNENEVRSLLEGKYMEDRENVVLVGHPGTGKTHLARALGYAACVQGRRVFYTTASALVAQLIEHHSRLSLRRFLKKLDRMDLVIVDEIGYVPFSGLEAQLLFELFSGGYEQISFVITTTVPLERWADVFGNERLAEAVVNRLADRVHFIETKGEPYRRSRPKSILSPRFRTS
jgi:DNA replication protein DnaC